MKREELNKIYTEYVNKYLQKGWLIDTQCKAGHQGEIVKTVLVNLKEKTRMCLWLENKYKYKELYNNIIFRIGTQPINDSFWLDSLNIIFEKYYFNIGNTYKEWYIDNYEEALLCQEINYKRLSKTIYSTTSTIYEYENDNFINYAWNWLKKTKPKGMSKYRKKDILYIQKKKLDYKGDLFFLIKFKDGNYINFNKK